MKTTTQQAENEWFGHPKGVYICFATELWERFSFYGMKALLFLYLTKYHLFSDRPSYELLGAYGGLVYAMPVIGGMIADRYLGLRKAVILGGILLVLGHFGMAIEGHEARYAGEQIIRDEEALQVFYLSLALIITGVGFLKPNISTIVGRLYAENDPRRDSGFTLFYAGINLGALAASLIAAFLGEVYGWKYGFGAAGVGMVIGLAVFILGQKHLRGLAEPPDPARLKANAIAFLSREKLIYGGAILMVTAVWHVIQWHSLYLKIPLSWLGSATVVQQGAVIMIMHTIFIGFLIWLIWFLIARCTPIQRQQMLVLIVLIFAALVFFTLYEQTYGSWVAFTDRMLTKNLFDFNLRAEGWHKVPWMIAPLVLSPLVMLAALNSRRAGGGRIAIALIVAAFTAALFHDIVLMPQTAGSLTFLGAFFIVALTPLFTWLWPWLERRGLNPGKPLKSAGGLVLAGLAFAPLIIAAQAAASGDPASVWWLVLAYLILEMGELALSPVGLSAVTQLSVKSVVSVMMGAWFLATAYSENLAAELGKLSAVEMLSDGSFDHAEAAAGYGDLFWLMLFIGVISGGILALAAPLLNRAMHGVR